jgi:D-hydroxyproline dehydrogenase subunit beta
MVAHPTYDDAVIGAGILGLAHAYELARRGRRVVVFERHPRASGASIRNFGMLWPIGQPFGPARKLAVRSLEIWGQILTESQLWHDTAGSLHLAYRDDEAQVLREFAALCADHGEAVEMLAPREISERAPAVKQDGLQLALYSSREVCVDPRAVIARLPGWLAAKFGVVFHFDSPIAKIELPDIVSGSRRWTASRSWVCSGDELGLLFAEDFMRCGLVRCKLQMMRSHPFGGHGPIGPMLAGGLTLRHYGAFRNCPGLATLKHRVARESPWLDHYGIHVMVSQNGQGELTIGDSHLCGDLIEPFDQSVIDEWILGYLGTFLDTTQVRIESRWHGNYVKHPTDPYVVIHPAPGVTAVTGVGGAGMTLSFGLAEQVVRHELDGSEA